MAEGRFEKKALFSNKETKISTFKEKYDVAPSLSSRLVVINFPYKWQARKNILVPCKYTYTLHYVLLLFTC